MNLPNLKQIVTATTLAAVAALGTSTAALANGKQRLYRVSITNITPGNQFTPVLAAIHRPSVGLFEVGEESSAELATLAETGNTAPLESVLSGLNSISAVSTNLGPSNGLTFAGETVQFTLSASRYSRVFSMAAMILPTNDSFVALDTVRLPYRGSVSYFAKGYDAGSEDNDELCINIPGPTCGEDGEGPEGEGFVHISGGIHGIGDLPEEIYDWRNPVAKVTITRVW